MEPGTVGGFEVAGTRSLSPDIVAKDMVTSLEKPLANFLQRRHMILYESEQDRTPANGATRGAAGRKNRRPSNSRR